MKNTIWRAAATLTNRIEGAALRLGAVGLAIAGIWAGGMGCAAVARGQERVGEVAFENSGSVAAQKDFLHGLAQLHNFEFEFAAEDFQKAEKIDPGFAMAYWGEAMSFNHPLWAQQDADAARAALKKLGATPEERMAKAKTEREKAYLRAVETLYGEGTKFERDFKYAEAMKQLHEKYPSDIDGTCFYALSLLGTAHNGRDIPTYMRAAGLLEDIFYAHPNHPGAAHYLIHSFDDPVHAPLGLPAARAYSKIAPDAGHAQHMTSHIFLALGMWDDVIRANVTATSVVNGQRKAAGKPESFCGHYNEWLAYAYLQTGNFTAAKNLTAGCRKQAEKVASSGHAHGGRPAGSFVDMRAQYVMGAQEWNGEAVGWNTPGEPSLEEQSEQAYVTAYAAAMRGDDVAAKTALAKMDEIAPKLPAEFEKESYGREEWIRVVPEIEAAQIHVLLLANEKKMDAAIELAKKTAKQEEALPYAFGPPTVAKPSLELLGEMQLKSGYAAEAKATFEASLAHTPRRTISLEGLLAAQRATGDTAGAAETAETLKEIRKNADGLMSEQSGAAPQPIPVEEDPTHHVVLRNDAVIVMHVVIPAGESSQYHVHARDRAAFDLSTGSITQQNLNEAEGPSGPVKPGDFAVLTRGAKPVIHRVHNTGSTAFEVLDVEFLKRPETASTVAAVAAVAGENPCARVYKWVLEPGATAAMHTHERPYLILSTTAMKLKMTGPDGQSMGHEVKAGDFHWVDGKVTHALGNDGTTEGVVFEVELK